MIIIINNPQTQFAKTLNHRIYRDTTFIRYLKESWFFEYDMSKGYASHLCGYDLYFYSLSGESYTFLNSLNSSCELDKIGVKNLNILLQMGEPLKVDTLERIAPGMSKSNLFNENLIEAKYKDMREWGNTKSRKYPMLYYDGYFKTNIQLDTHFTINQNAENFIRTFTDNLTHINWNISKYTYSPNTENDLKIKNFIDDKKPCSVEITVYLKSSKFDLFPDYEIKKTYFQIKRGKTLLLFYRN